METRVKFKDVAHLYLYCEVEIRNNSSLLMPELFTSKYDDIWNEMKPKLRPLSDMKMEEGAWCLKETFFDHVDYPLSDFSIELVGENKQNPRVSIDNDWYQEDLTFGNATGSIWSTKNVPPAHIKIKATIYAYLLKQRFDLFGLIQSGQAIELISDKKS